MYVSNSSKEEKQISQLKMGNEPNKTLLRRRYIKSEQMYQTVFNTTNFQGNANWNHEIASHTCLDGYYKKDTRWEPGGSGAHL